MPRRKPTAKGAARVRVTCTSAYNSQAISAAENRQLLRMRKNIVCTSLSKCKAPELLAELQIIINNFSEFEGAAKSESSQVQFMERFLSTHQLTPRVQCVQSTVSQHWVVQS